jgi:hypothetical protein
MIRLRVFAATGVLLLVAADAAAQKTDVVVLRNGDRFTCEVKELSRGQLRISTDDAGTIYIEWDKIAAVTTAGSYEVTTIDGTQYVGQLQPDTPTTVQVFVQVGVSTSVPFVEIVEIRSIKSRFFQRIDGSFDVGGSYTKSSGVGQISVSLSATYRRPGFELFTNFDANRTSQQEAETTSRFAWTSGYNRFHENRWVVTPFVFVERNPDLGLTLRGEAALAAGRYLHRSLRGTTVLTGGIAAGVEEPIEGDSIANIDALAAFATSFYRYDYPKQNVDFSLLVFPSLNDWGRVRANLRAKFRQELLHDFTGTVTFYDTYDSRPPVANVEVNDFGVTFAIGWVF